MEVQFQPGNNGVAMRQVPWLRDSDFEIDPDALTLLNGAEWAERVRGQIQKAVVGQDVVIERLLVALLADGHVLIEGMPGLAKTLLVKSLGTAMGLNFERIQFTPDLLPERRRRHHGVSAARRLVPRAPRSDLRQPRAGRRDQPRPRQGAERSARSHAGTAGHHRRPVAHAAAAVPGDGDAEPDRAGRHLSAARGADRPLPVQADRRLPLGVRGTQHDAALGTDHPATAAHAGVVG